MNRADWRCSNGRETLKLVARLCFIAIACLWISGLSRADAHEIRPAALELAEQGDGTVKVIWKQPILSGRKLRLKPILPQQCNAPSPAVQSYGVDAVIETWQVSCRLDRGTVAIDGLDQTLTDVFLRISLADNSDQTYILRPAANSVALGSNGGSAPAASFLAIGAEHMLLGWDHLLFVLGLLLLTPLRRIIAVVTAFTVGHSITLAITALGWFTLPSEPVELLIALSIFFLAVENVRKQAGKTSLAIRKPWLIAAAFGLLHGLGFAGALAAIGLPKGEELWALLLFNLGVEIGQLIFIAAILGSYWLISRFMEPAKKWANHLALYTVGSLGAYFTLSRIFA